MLKINVKISLWIKDEAVFFILRLVQSDEIYNSRKHSVLCPGMSFISHPLNFYKTITLANCPSFVLMNLGSNL